MSRWDGCAAAVVEPRPISDNGWDYERQFTPKCEKAALRECKTQFSTASSQHKSSTVTRGHFKHVGRVRDAICNPSYGGALCQENNWSWFDLAGNCTLKFQAVLSGARGGHEGVNEPVRVQRPKRCANLGFRPEAGSDRQSILSPENAGTLDTERFAPTFLPRCKTNTCPQPGPCVVNKVEATSDQWFVNHYQTGFRVLGLTKDCFKPGEVRTGWMYTRDADTLRSCNGRSLNEKLKVLRSSELVSSICGIFRGPESGGLMFGNHEQWITFIQI